MQATGEDLHAGLVAVTLLVGVLLASDPQREELILAYRQSLALLEQHPQWRDAAAGAKAYGESILDAFSNSTA